MKGRWSVAIGLLASSTVIGAVVGIPLILYAIWEELGEIEKELKRMK